MNSPSAANRAPGEGRPRFQFNLRSLLILTALTAWMFGWVGIGGIFAFGFLACMALVEAGCTRGANVLGVLVRNLLAFFVCSLVFGAVGFGLMFGSNPTGWFGMDQFLFAPLLDPVEIASPVDPIYWLPIETIACAIAIAIAHRVLAVRGRPAAYLLFWIVLAGLVYPLVGSWMADSLLSQYAGWLVRLGFVSTEGSFVVLLSMAGWAALAGALVFRSRFHREDLRLSLFSPHCHHLLVSLGIGLPWLFFAVVPLVPLMLSLRSGNPDPMEVGFALLFPAAAVAGLVGAAVGSLVWLHKLHFPLVLSGGLGGVIAILMGNVWISPLSAAVIGLISGVLVVLTSCIFDFLRIDDPGGAVAVHGVCGALGMLLVGLFPNPYSAPGVIFLPIDEARFPVQLLGVVVCFVAVFLPSAGLFFLIRRKMSLAASGESADQAPPR